MPLAGFKTATRASEQAQPRALDCSATGIGKRETILVLNCASRHDNGRASGVQLPAFLPSVIYVCGQFHTTAASTPQKQSQVPTAYEVACVLKVGPNATALVYCAEENFLSLLRIESGLFGIQPVI